MEAARSLGMSHGDSMRYVIIPQAIRKVIPPLLNDMIALMKDTSLVAFIGLVKPLQAGRDIYAETFNNSGYIFGGLPVPVADDPAGARGRHPHCARATPDAAGGGGGDDVSRRTADRRIGAA